MRHLARPVTARMDANARRRFRRRLQRSGRLVRGWLDLAITARGRLVGEIQFRQHPAQALPPGVAELGIGLYDAADRGHGYGSAAVALLTRWLFERGVCARVQASTAVENLAMRRVLERLGFTFEGVMRSFMPGPSGREDFALYAMTAGDWRSGAPSLTLPRGGGRRGPHPGPPPKGEGAKTRGGRKSTPLTKGRRRAG